MLAPYIMQRLCSFEDVCLVWRLSLPGFAIAFFRWGRGCPAISASSFLEALSEVIATLM